MAHGPAKRRVILMDDDADRLSLLVQAVTAEGHTVVGRFDTGASLGAAVAQLQPDLVLISVDTPTDKLLDALARLQREQPKPTVLFAAHSDAELTRRAVQTGVSAYVVDGVDGVDGLQPSRLRSLIEIAATRFEWQRGLREELDEARIRLADQRDIGKAKGVIMKRRELDEDAAYHLLQRMAMDRKQRIGDFSRALLVAADAL